MAYYIRYIGFERGVVLCRGDLVSARDIALPLGVAAQQDASENLKAIEAEHIKKILDTTGWNFTEAADRLGIHRNTLRLKIKEYDIKKKQKN